MQKANLSWLFILNVFLVIVLVISLAKPASVQSALSTNLVISEIQAEGAATSDDFIELYNPTASDINLGDFRLVKRTADATGDDSIVAFNADDVIPAHGYFLWCNSGLAGTLGCDRNTGAIVSNNNSVAIRDGDLDAGTLVDAVAFGTVTNILVEGPTLTLPGAGQSVERKANSGSTADSMTSGADVNGGNGEDTDNNANDFVLRLVSEPQNSTSSAEIPTASPGPSASESASPSPSEEPSASPSANPSAEPSASPSASPTESPSASPSASPSTEPSASPSASVSPSPSASASASPSISPSPSATPQPSHKPKKRISCTVEPQTFKFGKWEFTFKVLSCSWIQV